MTAPTNELYDDTFALAYDYFNEQLFNGELPSCILTVQRGKAYYGFFSPMRWKKSTGEYAHEIAMNTSYFTERTLIQVLQTLVHEQCHLWQQEFGKPSRSGYHNKEWANKMESVGLMPSSTHAMGGKRTGQNMGDYPIAGGRFEQACIELVKKGYFIKWVDRSIIRINAPHDSGYETDDSELPTDDINAVEALNKPLIEQIDFEPFAVKPADTSKTKYTCACENNVWGKAGLELTCKTCKKDFQVTN